MNRKQRRILQKQGIVSRTFSYNIGQTGEKGSVSLNFTLRVDIKDELKSFLECLEAAVADVKEEIAK